MIFNRSGWKKIVLICFSFLLITNAMSLTQSRAEEDFIQLKEIVVTATRSEESIEDIPVVVQVIDEEDIKISGITNVGDLIAQKVTSHVYKNNGVLQPAGLRGFHSDALGDDIKGHVLVLIDGHRLGTGNLAKINTDFIERIEVIKGPASALYGSAAFGGVINIITKKGKGNLKAQIGEELGSFRYNKTLLTSDGDITKSFSYATALSYEDTGNYYTREYGEVFNTDQRRKDIALNLSYYPTPEHNLRIGYMYADIIASYPSWKDYPANTTYNEDEHSYSDKSHFMGDLEYNGKFLNGDLHWKSLLYYLWDRNSWYYGLTEPEDSLEIYDDVTLGTDQQFTLNAISNNTIILGITYEKLEKDSEGKENKVASTPSTPNLKYTTLGIYAQDSIRLFKERINLILGLRYDLFNFSTKMPQSATYESFLEKDVDFDNVTPRMGLSYKYNERLKIATNISQGFKAPSADQMASKYEYTTYYGQHRILGNPDLKPEKTTNYEIGISFTHEQWRGEINLFHTDYTDRIEDAKEDIMLEDQNWPTYENRGGADIEGIDINFTWLLDKTFNWGFGWDLSSSITFNTKYEDSETKEKLNYISDYDARSCLTLHYKESIISLSYILVGPQMIKISSTETEKKSTFNLFDLSLTQSLYDRLELKLSINNLFDQKYEWVKGYPMAERNYKIGLSYYF